MPVKPSESEDEYFARVEFEKATKAAEERAARLATEERESLRKLHHMRCPKCGMELAEIQYHHIHIDRCTSCQGIWLDAGELESIVDKEEDGGFLSSLTSLFSGGSKGT